MKGKTLAWSDDIEGDVVHRIGRAARETAAQKRTDTIVVCTSDGTATQRAAELVAELDDVEPWVLVAVTPAQLESGGWRKEELFASPVFVMSETEAREVGALEEVLA